MKHFNILNIFKRLDNESYCLIKKSEIFPKYIIGSDFDIFCYDAIAVSEKIASYFNEHITDSLSLRITTNENKIVVDVLDNNSIYLRFDLYRKLPNFEQVSIRDSFFLSVIENHQVIVINDQEIFIPSDLDDAILRYIEYYEWFDRRPDKIKHALMVEKYINDKKIDELAFLNKLHYYLKFPVRLDARRVSQNSLVRKLKRVLRKISRVIPTFRKNGFLPTMKIIIQRIKQ